MEKYFSANKLNDDIYFFYLEFEEMNDEIAQILVEERKKITNGKDCYVIIEAGKVKKIAKKERDYMASDIATQNLLGVAFILKSPVQKMIGNFFLSFNKPKVKAKIFLNKEDALDWINTLKQGA
jgi:hypothetical protein